MKKPQIRLLTVTMAALSLVSLASPSLADEPSISGPGPKKEIQDTIRQKFTSPDPGKQIPVETMEHRDSTSEEYIPCPAESVTTGVTTRIAHPWWSTPQEGGIEKVDVILVGGKQTLLCSYRAYNDVIPVMREFPPGRSRCYPKGRGFVCH